MDGSSTRWKGLELDFWGQDYRVPVVAKAYNDDSFLFAQNGLVNSVPAVEMRQHVTHIAPLLSLTEVYCVRKFKSRFRPPFGLFPDPPAAYHAPEK